MPKRQHSIESYSQLPSGQTQVRKSASFTRTPSSRQGSLPTTSTSTLLQPEDAMTTPKINSYGSTYNGMPFSASRTSLVSSDSSDEERDPLLPSAIPGPETGPSTDLIPFKSVIDTFCQYPYLFP